MYSPSIYGGGGPWCLVATLVFFNFIALLLMLILLLSLVHPSSMSDGAWTATVICGSVGLLLLVDAVCLGCVCACNYCCRPEDPEAPIKITNRRPAPCYVVK